MHDRDPHPPFLYLATAAELPIDRDPGRDATYLIHRTPNPNTPSTPNMPNIVCDAAVHQAIGCDAAVRDAAVRNAVDQTTGKAAVSFPDLMFRVDAHGILVGYYPSQVQEIQWLKDSCVGQPIETVLSEDLAAWVTHYVSETLATGALQSGEYVLSVNQRWHHYEARFMPDADQTVLAIVRDITDRKMMEAAMRVSELQHHQRALELERTLKELRETQAQLIQSEKLSSLGQLVAGVAHEINNPVSFIHGNLEHVEGYVEDLLFLLELYQAHFPNPGEVIESALEEVELPFIQEDLPAAIASMRMGTKRICEIVTSLRKFSRKDEAEKKPCDIHEGIDSTLVILQHRLKARQSNPGVEVFKDYGIVPKIECYGSQLNQVFMNLISNAIDAMESNNSPREIYIRTRVQTTESAEFNLFCDQQPVPTVAISIADTGCGIPDHVRSHLFDPFFTTKPVGKGTGLGLSISHNIIVKQHGGALLCNSMPDGGTQFTILLPMCEVCSPPGLGGAVVEHTFKRFS